jgi:SAM-dependent methyltransferase
MDVYTLGSNPDETARLRRQSEELRPYAEELLARIGLRPGQSAIDLGCGPAGILDLLAAAVGPRGRVIGVDADPVHAAMAHELALTGVEIITADARQTGLPADSFDLVHARMLLAPIGDPEDVVAEMTRLARPGGWVASQEPDVEHALCFPAVPAWDRLIELFRASHRQLGADPCIGRRTAGLFRDAGLVDIEVTAYSPVFPVGHSRRTVLPDLLRDVGPAIQDLGLADQAELNELDHAVRAHLADPHVIVIPHLLFVVAGRKPPLILSGREVADDVVPG